MQMWLKWKLLSSGLGSIQPCKHSTLHSAYHRVHMTQVERVRVNRRHEDLPPLHWKLVKGIVQGMGFDPKTSWQQARCSSNWANLVTFKIISCSFQCHSLAKCSATCTHFPWPFSNFQYYRRYSVFHLLIDISARDVKATCQPFTTSVTFTVGFFTRFS